MSVLKKTISSDQREKIPTRVDILRKREMTWNSLRANKQLKNRSKKETWDKGEPCQAPRSCRVL